MANRSNRQSAQASAEVLSAAISAIERRAVVAGGKVNFGSPIVAGGFAGRFPTVDLETVLAQGMARKRFVLSGADGRTVLTLAKAQAIKADSKAKAAEKKTARLSILSKVEAAIDSLAYDVTSEPAE